MKTLRELSNPGSTIPNRSVPELLRRRAHHVTSENRRTLAAVKILARGDTAQFGELLTESHCSLRDDFEVSTRELDLIVAAAQTSPLATGARLTGAGFGGAAISCFREPPSRDEMDLIAQDYLKSSGREAHIEHCAPADGLRVHVRYLPVQES